MIKFNVMTLFPDMINSYISESMMKRAIENKIIEVNVYNIRDYSNDKHKKVDDYPFGGGAGMVMTPQPIKSTFDHINKSINTDNFSVIYMSPRGRVFNQEIAKELSKKDEIVILCGHYEGVDQRVIDTIVTDEISLGDFVLTGGELPALSLIDAVSRLVPGVLNKSESFEDESFEHNLLEYPQYTRPRDFEGSLVPDVLLSGNHKNIDKWRLEMSENITLERRPDLWKKYKKSDSK